MFLSRYSVTYPGGRVLLTYKVRNVRQPEKDIQSRTQMLTDMAKDERKNKNMVPEKDDILHAFTQTFCSLSLFPQHMNT